MTNNEQVAVEQFKREWRYIVVKRKHITAEQEILLVNLVNSFNLPEINCAVVESDWPEYETVWRMIEDRVTGSAEEPVKDTHHFPEGPWLQPDGKYVGYCRCGERYKGRDGGEAELAWLKHYRSTRLSATPTASEGDLEDAAWAWMATKWSDHPNDRGYAGDEMVDAFIAGFEHSSAALQPKAQEPDADVVERVARVIQDEASPGFGISDLAYRQARAAITAIGGARS